MRHEGLMKDVLEGGIDGQRGRGRPRIGMFHGIDERCAGRRNRRTEGKRKAKNRYVSRLDRGSIFTNEKER